ncbi:MAG TPA: hypothetical protein VFE45_00745, partial [Coriobacteriia bacterium]|nr:hypothetical protein [Coriobacteriia bacterium]
PIAQSALAGQLSHELTIAGPLSGAYVFDLTTATPLFSQRALGNGFCAGGSRCARKGRRRGAQQGGERAWESGGIHGPT